MSSYFKGIGASLILGLAAATAAPAQADGISIGGVFPLSGPNAIYGEIFQSSLRLAEDHIRDDQMLDGGMRILYEDSQALPQQAVLAMNKLVSVNSVPFVMSAFTGPSKAIAPIANRSKTVVVNGGGVGPDLAKLGEYFWNVIPLANTEMRSLLPYMVEEQGYTKFTLIYVDDPLGEGVLEVLEEQLPELGATLVNEYSIPATAQQFGGLAANIRNDDPDVVFLASYGDQQVQIIKQLRQNGVTARFASYSAFSTPTVQALPEAAGALYATQAIDFEAEDAFTRRFVDDFKAAYGKLPTVYATNYYNAAMIFAMLGKELQAQGKPITGENLLEQRRQTESFALVGGSVSFDEKGTLIAPIQIMEVDGSGGKVLKIGNP